MILFTRRVSVYKREALKGRPLAWRRGTTFGITKAPVEKSKTPDPDFMPGYYRVVTPRQAPHRCTRTYHCVCREITPPAVQKNTHARDACLKTASSAKRTHRQCKMHRPKHGCALGNLYEKYFQPHASLYVRSFDRSDHGKDFAKHASVQMCLIERSERRESGDVIL
jgi:hypothetical protein